ncbi:hypothetical protein CEXT_469541 [Caerostris extrusa]|uniref:Uncharacterized protein n=1 Tax=Caerostris extrusa TaxID=172846 RepID=A0AAV4PDA3_CAEEX|nr:hypothetical protein CEXT_469541 [Caerostris extrusa]
MASVSFVQLRASKWRVGLRGWGGKGLLASDIRGLRSECSTNLIRWPTHATLPSAGVGGRVVQLITRMVFRGRPPIVWLRMGLYFSQLRVAMARPDIAR